MMPNANQSMPVLYGPAYLDAEQQAKQDAMVASEPSRLYGPNYLPGVGDSRTTTMGAGYGDGPADRLPLSGPGEVTGTPALPPSAPVPPQYTVTQLEKLLTKTALKESPNNFLSAFKAEALRPEGARKGALVLLIEAAKTVGDTERGAALQEMLDSLNAPA